MSNRWCTGGNPPNAANRNNQQPLTIDSFGYTYDNHDRRTAIDLVRGAGGPEPVEWGRWNYTYDSAGQLTGGTRTGPKLDQQTGTLVQYGYQYDAMGQPRLTDREDETGDRAQGALQ